MENEGATGFGRLYGVGVGPGDPELLTLKAVRILRQVPVISVPQAEASPESYAFNIVKQFVDLSKQELLRLPFPTTGGDPAPVWEGAAESIASHLHQGEDVAFIAEGDPTLYSTFSYVHHHIRRAHPNIQVEIVPGVSSVMAAAASAGVPLASHSQSVAILPAMYGIDDLRRVLDDYDTVVLMKVNSRVLKALADFESLEPDRITVYARRVTTPQEKVICDIRQLSPQDLEYFSLFIITRLPSDGKKPQK